MPPQPSSLSDQRRRDTNTRVTSAASRRASTSPARPVQLPDLMDIAGVAKHLGVSVRHVRKLVAQRRIPYIKWGNLLRFDPNTIASWLDEKAVSPQIRAQRACCVSRITAGQAGSVDLLEGSEPGRIRSRLTALDCHRLGAATVTSRLVASARPPIELKGTRLSWASRS